VKNRITLLGIKADRKKEEEYEDDNNDINNKEEIRSSSSRRRNNEIIEILTKGKIELSQIFIAPAIVAFGILQILSGETSPMTWLVLSISYWLIFALTLFLFLTQYLRIITLQTFIRKKYSGVDGNGLDKEIDKMMEFKKHKVFKKIFDIYYKSSEKNLFRLLYIILFIFILIAFSLWPLCIIQTLME
jgi:ABC-type transport system involved in Fe-S cluster assembly fused permease/ATPase subunit